METGLRRLALGSLALGLVALLTSGVGVALADAEHYETLTAAPATYRSALDGGDAVALDAPITHRVTNKVLDGNPTIAVSARFSNSATETCVLTCVLYHVSGDTYTLLGQKQATATATTYTLGSTTYVAQTLYFDASGATHYEIRAADPSVGTVTLVAWSFGKEAK